MKIQAADFFRNQKAIELRDFECKPEFEYCDAEYSDAEYSDAEYCDAEYEKSEQWSVTQRAVLTARAPVASLSRRRNPHLLAILGDGPASDTQTMFLQLNHQLIIAPRMRLVLFVDDLLKLDSDGLVSHIFAVCALSTEHKEAT